MNVDALDYINDFIVDSINGLMISYPLNDIDVFHEIDH